MLMGIFKLGSLNKYIPIPITIVGFTTGIAVTIFSGQIASFLGIEKHEEFIKNLKEIFVQQTLSAVSQHLQILRAKNIVTGTKQGNKVIYTLKDPMIMELFAVPRQIYNNHLVDTITILDKLKDEEEEVTPGTKN